MFLYFLSNLGMGAGGSIDPIICSSPFAAYVPPAPAAGTPCNCS